MKKLLTLAFISFILTVNCYAQTNIQDSLALVAFYENTNGDNWKYNDNWLTGNVDTWFGITVANNRVTKIKLINNYLIGRLPFEIGNFTELIELELYQNELNGSFPSEIGSLESLEKLNLRNNNLDGNIPTEIGALNSLTELNLGDNSFSGNILSEVGSLTGLKILSLKNNSLSGSIPQEIKNLTNLTNLNLSGNSLSGNMFPEIGNLIDLSVLDFSNNSITGVIPSEIKSLKKLISLNLQGNIFTGSIPSEIGYLTNLMYLQLNGNDFTGVIPPEIGLLTNLMYLQLDDNRLIGTIPSEVGELVKLAKLSFSYNLLTGNIPSEIGNLTNLMELYLDFNSFSGGVPDDLSNLTKLLSLKINNNELSGLPDMTANSLLLPQYGGFLIQNNNFDFADIEPNISILPYAYMYANQAAISVLPYEYELTEGESLALTVETEGINNQYRWYRDGVAVTSKSISPDYNISSITSTDYGLYKCYVTNTVVPDLSLETNTIRVFGKKVYTPLELDSLALIAFYVATNGNNWNNKTSWLNGSLNSWYGITVENDRVTRVNLQANSLSGSIPDEIGVLTKLTHLYIGNNSLSGEIPHKIEDLTNLKYLNFGFNELSGNLPAEIGTLTVLEDLNLESNSLSGNIPLEIGNLTNLVNLRLQRNLFSGSIPSEIGGLSDLSNLNLNDNFFSGSIPFELGDLVNLTLLNLSNNTLSGSIPSNLGELINLTQLNLGNNSLSGNILDEIGNLTNLTELLLHRNSLSGNIPSEIGALTNLDILYLQYNSLSGSIPSKIGDLINLTDLSLQYNELSGNIPPEISALTNLVNLNLYNNSLSGTIPSEIGNLSNLTVLDLTENSLSGSLPVEIGNLNNLITLHLANNVFTGAILPEIGSLTNLLSLDLSHNSLFGNIPSEIGSLANLGSLNLEWNLLNGIVPQELSNLQHLTEFKINNNKIVSFPDMSANYFDVSKNNLQIQSNNLGFGSIEPNMSNLSYFTNYVQESNYKIYPSEYHTVIGESLSLSFYMDGENNQYQWFKKGVAVSEISSSSQFTINSVIVDDLGEYYCEVTNTKVTDLTITTTSVTVNNSYCIPQGDCSLHITKVEMGTIVNISECSAYSDFSDQYTMVVSGDSLSCKITVSESTQNYNVKAWIDWDEDGFFIDEAEISLLGTNGIYSFNIEVLSTYSDEKRLRIILGSTDEVLTPCSTTISGEVEDYTISIVDALSDGISHPNNSFWDDRFTFSGINSSAEILDMTADENDNLYILGNKLNVINGEATRNVVKYKSGQWQAVGKGLPDFDEVYAKKIKIISKDDELYCIHAPAIYNRKTGMKQKLQIPIAYWNGLNWSEFNSYGITKEFEYDFMKTQMAVHNGDIYVSGNFYEKNTVNRLGNIARWTGTDWEIVCSDMPLSVVDKMVIDANGNIYILSVERHKFAVWNVANEFWQIFVANGDIHDIALNDNSVYICGEFNEIEGNQANRVAKLYNQSWQQIGSPSDLDGVSFDTHWRIYHDGENLWLTGDLEQIGKQGSSEVFYIDEMKNEWFNTGTVSGTINSIAGVSDGNYFSGKFINLIHNNGIKVADDILFYKTKNNNGWKRIVSSVNNHTVSDNIETMEYDGDKNIYVGGSFKYAAGYTVPYFAFWNGEAWNGMEDEFPLKIRKVKDIQIDNETIYVLADDIDNMGHLYKLADGKWNEEQIKDNRDDYDDLEGFSIENGTIYLIFNHYIDKANYESQIYIKGFSEFVIGKEKTPIDRLFFNNGLMYLGALGSNWYKYDGSSIDLLGYYDDVALSGDTVYALANGSINKLLPDKIILKTNEAPAGNRLFVNGDKMVVTGTFSDVNTNGEFMKNIAFWDGNQWLELAGGLSGGQVNDVIIKGSEIYAGGSFQIAGDRQSTHFAHYNSLQIDHNGNETNGNIEFCKNGDNILNVSDAYSGYKWYKDKLAIEKETPNELQINEDGNYYVEVFYQNGSSSFSNTVNVKVNSLPTKPTIITEKVNKAKANYFCKGDKLSIFLSESYFSYQWEGVDFSGNGQTAAIDALTSGLYRVTVGNQFNCETTSDDIQLYHYPEITKPIIRAIVGDNGYVLACKAPVGAEYNYQWYENDQSAKTIPNVSLGHNTRIFETTIAQGDYYIVVSDTNQCTAKSEIITLSQIKSAKIYPNPNKGECTLVLSKGQQIKRIVVKDMLGRKINIAETINQGNSIKIKFPVNEKGIFIIEAYDRVGERYTKKVFVE